MEETSRLTGDAAVASVPWYEEAAQAMGPSEAIQAAEARGELRRVEGRAGKEKTEQIALRLQKRDLELARALAEQMELPYQTLLKQVIHEGLLRLQGGTSAPATVGDVTRVLAEAQHEFLGAIEALKAEVHDVIRHVAPPGDQRAAS